MSNIQQLSDVHEHQHDFLASSWRPLPNKDSRPMGLCNSSCTPISGGKPCSRAATTSVAKDFRRRDLSPPGALGANNPTTFTCHRWPTPASCWRSITEGSTAIPSPVQICCSGGWTGGSWGKFWGWNHTAAVDPLMVRNFLREVQGGWGWSQLTWSLWAPPAATSGFKLM